MFVVDRPAVQQRLADLKRVDPTLDLTFGASEHRFVLAPPLSERNIEAFEKANGVALPEAYREFLLRVGGSGAGPGYGLTGLRRTVASVAGSCPLTKADAEQVRRRREAGEDDAFAPLPVPGEGVLSLCDHGCGWESYLVVSGSQRGAVWVGGDLGWFPEADDFTEWYEAWLREPLTA